MSGLVFVLHCFVTVHVLCNVTCQQTATVNSGTVHKVVTFMLNTVHGLYWLVYHIPTSMASQSVKYLSFDLYIKLDVILLNCHTCISTLYVIHTGLCPVKNVF